MTPTAASAAAVATRQRLADHVALAKPRVVFMVLVTTVVGFYLGSDGPPNLVVLAHTLLGTALAAGGTLALNQYAERDLDARMHRTRQRPLPEGRLVPAEALGLGLTLLAAGLVYLAATTPTACTVVTAVIGATYLLLYTPLKRVTSLNTIVGAVPGALPPVAGWAAARGAVSPDAWILFAIMFLWQIPHTLAIGRLYRDDYARAGIRVLPVIDWDGRSTGLHAVTNALALIPVSLLPTMLGMAGPLYFFAALALGLAFVAAAVRMARHDGAADARRLLFASLIYLPALLAMLVVDKLAA